MASDAELLSDFAERGDEAAFAEIVRRHGAMVHRVCLRALGDAHEAEDAAQAAFLVLVRQARSVRRGASLAAWLHGTARQVSREALRARTRRGRREEAAGMVADRQSGPVAEAERREVLRALDAEVAALPERERQAVVLRYLEGLSQAEAAELAGCPQGTLGRRASEGLERLRQRVCQRGCVLGATALVGLLAAEAQVAAPASLLPSLLAVPKLAAAGAAAGAAGSSVVTLAEGAIRAMFWIKVKLAAAVLVGAAALGGGGAAVVIAAAEPAVPKAEGRTPIAESSVSEKGIECRVTELVAGGRVKLSAGSAQGVREKFEFDVSRDGKPIGTVKVTTVEEKQCTAEIASVTGEIKVGDTARTRFGTVLAGPGEQPVAPAEAGKIAWGEVVNGLQAGLVPLGGGTAKGWESFYCAKCENWFKAPVKHPHMNCGSCGADGVVKYCESCAAAKRICQVCGAAKPWGATFVEGEPMAFEVHLRNVGDKDAIVGGKHLLFDFIFTPVGGSVPRRGTGIAKVPMSPPGSGTIRVKQQLALVERVGGTSGAFAWRFEDARPAQRETLPPLEALPPGRYTVTASYEHAAGHPQSRPCTFWHGKVSTGAVEIEIRARGAAVKSKISEDQARGIALEAAGRKWPGWERDYPKAPAQALERAKLAGGLWTVRFNAPHPIAGRVADIVIDADSGAVVEFKVTPSW